MGTAATERALNAPVKELGRLLLELPEDQWFDRKSGRIQAADLANAMIGFANADGGTIVIGLANNQVEGVDALPARISAWQQAALDFTVPAVPCRSRLMECVNDDGAVDHLFVVELEPSENVHANRRDEVFLRVGDENRRLTFTQRQELLFDKGQATFESTTTHATKHDLDNGLLRSYANAVRHPDQDRLLAARGLVTPSGELTVAAVLLFASHPQTWFPEASVRVLRYQGSERGTGARQQLLSDVRLEGPIPVQLTDARQAVLDMLPTRRALAASGRFEQIGLVPQDAWLEALVNAVIHRSYSVVGDHIRVEIFDDRVEIESPGRFPGLADLSDPLNVTRFARNPRIARVCADLAFGQELGEGIRRMFEEMRLAGLADPVYRQTSGSVHVTLLAAPIDRALEERLPPGARDVLRLIREAGRISTGDVVQATGRSRPSVVKQLKALEQAGLITWTGQSVRDPRAYWSLKRL